MNYKNNTYFYIINIRGDVEAILDINGNEVASYSYDVWGVPTVTNTGGLPNPFLYQGAYGNIWDSEIELYYMNARHYDPSIGRFITQDREHGTLTNTMSQNLYIYCYNNPYGYKDPSGFTADLHEPIPNGTPICESGELSEQQQAMYDIAKEDNPELTIEEFLVIFSEAFNIVNKIQKYDDEMYNKYDLEIMFWTCYWNDKAKLGLTTDEKIEMANYIKAMAFIESDVGNADTTSQGFLQVTGHTWDVAKEFGYINLDDSYRENLGAKDPSMNAGIYAGIACFLMSLSKVQDDWGGGILENKNKTYSKTMKGYTPYKKLDDWIKERTNDDGSVDSIKWKDPNGGNRRILAAVADHGGSGFNTNMRNYNTKHGTNYLSGEFSHYAHGVDLLVRTGRNPKSWYGVGKNYLFVP